MSNIFKDNAKAFLDKGLSVIPDKANSKKPAINAWTDYCDRLPTQEEVEGWMLLFPNSNLSVAMGEASGIIALDFDAEDQKIIDLVEPLLPSSPVEKKGAKGWTRFFRYKGESTEICSYNGKVVFEVLSTKKKSTMPPSIHPDLGSAYKWTDKSLLDVDLTKLPLLPPYLISQIQSLLIEKLGAQLDKRGSVINGRNAHLSNYIGKLLSHSTHTADQVIRDLIKHDIEVNSPQYLTDPNEHRSTCEYTNALEFYASHLSSINYRRMKENKEFLTPVFEAVESLEQLKERAAKKSLAQVKKKSLNKSDSILVPSVIKTIFETINANSWIQQPELALGAALTIVSTLGGKNFTFQGLAPNLYVANILESGGGKNASLDFARRLFHDLNCDYLLGAGDYVSNASLVDSLPFRPVRLDIMDEVGGKLKTMNSSHTEYADKIGDILAELYTSSNSYYMGRALAGVNGVPTIRGACDRPNVNILSATTPTGFREGVTKDSIAKGLMGRFLLFFGDSNNSSTRVSKTTALDLKSMAHLEKLAKFNYVKNIANALKEEPSAFCEMLATKEADILLDKIFAEFDQLRLNKMGTPEAPIAARLYQQMIKLAMIHSIARPFDEVPIIEIADIEFAYSIIKCYYEELEDIIKKYIFNTPQEKSRYEVLSIIKEKGFIKHFELVRLTPQFSKGTREKILEDLRDAELIGSDIEKVEGKQFIIYFYKEN